jgi:hypothetical protein
MKLRRRMVAIMLSASMLAWTGARQVFAQDAPPNLRMLLNLDLFESRDGNTEGTPAPGAPAPDDSMLDQIRTLNAMGYLGKPATAQGSDAAGSLVGNARPPAAAPEPSNNPTFDVEGPQP